MSDFSITNKQRCTEDGEARYEPPHRQCTDKRLAYHNSATRLQWAGEEQGRRTHRITTFLPVSVQALLQPSFTFYTNELHQQLPERHSRQQSGTGAGNVGTVEIDT